jgi:sulfide:quinone oxidoreductase
MSMKRILILGAGTAGTIMANHLVKAVDPKSCKITLVDQRDKHYYQPGFLFVPFGKLKASDIQKDIRAFVPKQAEYIQQGIERIHAADNQVELADGSRVDYTVLIVATGSRIEPGEIEGLDAGWRKDIFDFYTPDGAVALQEKLQNWKGGKLVVHLAEMPIKCPVAPLEFTFLADQFFHDKKMRDQVDITYVTPLSDVFTKPTSAKVLAHMMNDKQVKVVTDFAIESVDADARQLRSYDEKTVEYDLLVTVPTNMGDPMIERSGLGDDLRFIPTHKHSLQSKAHENMFVIGDATDLPSSKAGSVAHFQAETLKENILRYMAGKPLEETFDGHSNCFIESGFGKAFLIDFNYDQEPLTGRFPLSKFGPLPLLKESRLCHWGKLAFRWIYWNLLLKARPIPGVSAQMRRSNG